MNNLLNILKNNSVKSFILLTVSTYIFSTILLAKIMCGGTACKDMVESWLILFPLIIIIFLPAFICIYYLYRKITNNLVRIILFSAIVPFYNLIYYYIDFFMNACDPTLSQIIGASWLFLILPAVLLTAIIIPKKFLNFKKEAIIISILMWFCGWGFIIAILPINYFINSNFNLNWYWNPFTIRDLEDYRPAIEYIKEYKAKHGVYPENILDLEINSSNFPYFTYSTENNRSEFILTVSNYKYFNSGCYRYCSSTKLQDCSASGIDKYKKHLKLGEWIYSRIDYD